MRAFSIFILSIFVAAFLVHPVHASEFTDAQKEAIKELVKEAIMENPQTLLDSVQAFQERQAEEEQAAQAGKITDFLANIPEEMKPFSVGNPDGDVHVIEFFDYNCGYCKKAFEEVQKILQEDDQVYVTFFEMPILGPSSLETAKWATAAADQGKYFDFHQALMEFRGQKNEETLADIAKNVGLDVDKIKAEKDSEKVMAFISNNVETARDLGFTGTPGFLINDMPVRGYLDFEAMKKAIADARN